MSDETDASATPQAAGLSPETPDVRWAPTETPKRRRRWGLRLGIPFAALGVGVLAASLVLIAPGTAVAGVPVGFLTAGAATDAISQRLAGTTVVLGEDGAVVTAAQLGAAVDAGTLAGRAYEERPLWNISQWFGADADAEITLDAATASAALREAAPELYTAPTPASVAFDGTSYVVTPAVDGEGLDVDAVAAALQDAFSRGETRAVLDTALIPMTAAATTAKAEAAAETLNTLLKEIGFYVGDERTVPVPAEVAASWLSVATDEDGDFTITADAAQIQQAVDALADEVDQKPADATVVTNAAGEVIRTVVEGQDGRVLGDVSGAAAAFAAQLATGDGVYRLPVDVTPHETKKLERLLEVDLSKQRLYLKQNGKVVDTWLISSGRPGAVTYPGHYSIGWKIDSQDMTGTARDSGKKYTQEDVPWVMYFNGNQAFHGAYWHNNFGNVMSAGCVNMPPALAKKIYDWAPVGADVWIHG